MFVLTLSVFRSQSRPPNVLLKCSSENSRPPNVFLERSSENSRPPNLLLRNLQTPECALEMLLRKIQTDWCATEMPFRKIQTAQSVGQETSWIKSWHNAHPNQLTWGIYLLEISGQRMSSRGMDKHQRCPTFRKGDKHLAENYHPTFLTSVTSKLQEHIIRIHMRNYQEQNIKVIILNQGFIPGFFCKTKLVTTQRS